VPGYRAKPNVILRRSMDHLGIWPRKTLIARATGISVRTISRALDGEPVSARTMQRLSEALDCSLDDLFEPIDPDGAAPSLRTVK
jgi:transcriptional regulator with XRE-family HTH domain